MAIAKKYSFKVSIIGCGNVGATAAYALLLKGIPTELTLVDVQKERARGLVLDMEHCLPFTSFVKLQSSNSYSACKNSDLVFITAGKRQAPGETRLDLVKANKKIFKEMIPAITAAAPNSILCVVSNPVDVMTYQTLKLSGFPSSRVFGSGTILDSARFQFHISEKIGVHPRSIDAYILGEHGDSSFPIWSSANVLGKPLTEFKGFSKKAAEKCYADTKNAAYRIIHDMGFTCYSIGTAMAEIAKNIKEDTRQVFPLSVLLRGYHGHSNVCLSVPCVLGREGIKQILEIPLNKKEKAALKNSVKILKAFN